MISLSEYISDNLIYEANFYAEDKKIAALKPKLQDVEKFKLLITKWDDSGEDLGPDYDLFDDFISKVKYSTDPTERKLKDKSIEAKNSISQLSKIDKSSKEYVKTAIKLYGAYIDILYKWAKVRYTYEDGFVDTHFIAKSFLSLGAFINNHTNTTDEVKNILLGKLIKKFDKDMGKIRGVDGLSAFLQMYNDTRVKMQQALEIRNATIKSMNDIEKERTKHKYTIIGGFNDHNGYILFFNNSKYALFDDIFKEKIIVQDKTNGTNYFKWTEYDMDKCLEKVARGTKIPACGLTPGYYLFDKNKDHVIPQFGFVDEVPEKIYQYSGYDNEIIFRGTTTKTDFGYEFNDNLWKVIE